MEQKWEIREIGEDDPYRFLLIRMDTNGNHHPCGHERFQHKKHAIARAKHLAKMGHRCDVLVDVAASFGLN
ncbi:hypothetical protein D3C76_283690 [compost metagenome]